MWATVPLAEGGTASVGLVSPHRPGKKNKKEYSNGTCHQCPCLRGKASVGITRTGCVNMNMSKTRPLLQGLWFNEDLGATSSIARTMEVEDQSSH